MYTESVVFTEHNVPWSGTNRFGKPSVLNVFTDAQGRQFQTFKNDIAAQLLATMGQTVTVEFEAKPNGEYINYDVKSVVLGGAPPVGAGGTAPQPASVQTAPVAAPPQTGAAPPQQNALSASEREERITRAASFKGASLCFGAAGIDPVVNHVELVEFADSVVRDYIINGRQQGEPAEEPVTVSAGAGGPVA